MLIILRVFDLFKNFVLKIVTEFPLRHIGAYVVLFLFQNQLFFSNILKNWANCIDGVPEKSTTNHYHDDYVTDFYIVLRGNIAIAHSTHCHDTVIKNLKILISKCLQLEISLVNKAIFSVFWVGPDIMGRNQIKSTRIHMCYSNNCRY